ncbi:uncharacterized protein DEA37_0008956 [Paragonimus westermani]|uniref:RNA-directed DNA polymerase n=1 Tax=Paragonimus westermani TaxID=34504 RepID=A0A5J4NQX1_9TREM|nr:uncharacterized protein DEA37_0008956 [Paragonimus westermani]
MPRLVRAAEKLCVSDSGHAFRVRHEHGLPAPEKYTIGEDFHIWEAQVRRYVRHFNPEQQVDIVLSLISREAYGKIVDFDIPENLEDLFHFLRRRIAGLRPAVEYRKKFHERRQLSTERLMDYMQQLRRLARMAFVEETQEQREGRILERFLEGIRQPQCQREFLIRPPKTLAKAEKLAELLDQVEHVESGDENFACVTQSTPADRLQGQIVRKSAYARGGHCTQCHPKVKAPNWQRCFTCGRHGHLARGCPLSARKRTHAGKSPVCQSRIPFVSKCEDKDVALCPVLKAKVGGRDFECLLDSGSVCSLLDKETYTICQFDAIAGPGSQVLAVNGQPLHILACVRGTVQIGKWTCTLNFFVVPKLPFHVVLGSNYLITMQCILDLPNLAVQVYGERFPLEPVYKTLAGVVEVRTGQHVTKGEVHAEFEWQKFRSTIISHLPAHLAQRVRDVIEKHRAIFWWEGQPPGRTHFVRHRIDTGEAHPIRQAARRLPVHLQGQVEQLLTDMLEKGIIRPSTSPWASPVVLVKKKDGSLRLCVDYRQLNAVTKKDSFPLPRIDDTIDALSGTEWFSTLDLASGYWQVEVEPSDRLKTAFVVPSGLYEFETMPFGLTNAPATFQRLMQQVLGDLIPKQCLVYLDDVIVHGRTVDEHLHNLSNVLSRLAEAGLKLNPAKCSFMRTEVKYLGHVISQSGVSCDPEKVRKVKEWPTPESVEEIRSFLGLASYYRRFVPRFSHIAKPLTLLTEKGRVFEWSEDCQQSFDRLKDALCTAPILALPDTRADAKMFILDTDASDVAIGAVLSQLDNNDKEHVIAYGNRNLNRSERNYCTTRKEMLALVHFIKHFRHYLLGRRFLVRTDHSSLQWLQNFKDPEGQVARWQEFLQEYNFECKHRPGLRHRNADALSRRPIRDHGDCPSCTRYSMAITIRPEENNRWAAIQSSDADLQIIYRRIKEGGPRPTTQEMAGSSWEARCLWSLWNHLYIADNVLYYQYGPTYESQIVVPESAVRSVLQELHENLGHAGQNKLEEAAKRRFWWPHQRRDVKDVCSSCGLCAQIKNPKRQQCAPLQSMLTGYPNEIVEVDIVGPLPETTRGNRYILVMVDHFTKWCEAVPVPRADGGTTAKFIFDHWISRWGAPTQLHTDRGSNFESTMMHELCRILGIRKTRTTAYHPQGNGAVERVNRTLKSLLKAFVSSENTRSWDEAVSQCLLAYRASVHSSTAQSPHYLLTGREMRLPSDLLVPRLSPDNLLASDYCVQLRDKLAKAYALAREHLRTAQRRQKDYYDRKAYGSPLKPGDKVWLRAEAPETGIPKKLFHEWKGPYVVHDIISESTCTIRDVNDNGSGLRVVHFNRLKPDTTGQDRSTNCEELEVAGECTVPPEGGQSGALRPVLSTGGSSVVACSAPPFCFATHTPFRFLSGPRTRGLAASVQRAEEGDQPEPEVGGHLKLYQFLVIDGMGHGRLVMQAYVQNENYASLRHLFETFREVMGEHIPARIFVMDEMVAQMRAARVVFGCYTMLCHFHVRDALTNRTTATASAAAKELANFYSTVFCPKECVTLNLHPLLSPTDTLQDMTVNAESVLLILLGLNTKKSPGADEITPLILKQCARSLYTSLTDLFNLSLNCSMVPMDWKCGTITPIFKGGDRSDVSNYRPVTLLPVISKVLERLVANKLTKHLEGNNILSIAQHGFRKSHSCLSNLLLTLDDWTLAIDNGNPIHACYLDMSKAFDRVNHSILLQKLKQHGVTGKLLAWLENYLMDRVIQVRVDGALSKPVAVTSGVPQGSVLGPTLFLIYANDIPNLVRCKIILFADDIKLWASIHTSEDCVLLQEDLNALYDWSLRNKLPFNFQKCKMLNIGKCVEFTYTLGPHRLAWTTDEKDLGVWISSSLKTSLQCTAVYKRTSKILALLKRIFGRFTRQTLPSILNTYIRPTMEYAVQVWSPWLQKDIVLLQRIYHRATKLGSYNPPRQVNYDIISYSALVASTLNTVPPLRLKRKQRPRAAPLIIDDTSEDEFRVVPPRKRVGVEVLAIGLTDVTGNSK